MLKLSIHLVDQNHLGLKIKQVLSQSWNTLLLREREWEGELEIEGKIGEKEEKEGKKEGREEGREKEEMEGK